ncbi:multicopper oxidase domain-containing protein, partial [Nocardioides sp.]|uniref:multicopper oxidase domain-containing protein n=1 Tax=Nocardioides sp. TaxID=35761 RepID=UPI0027326229
MTAATARGFWPMRDLPVVGWLLATLLVGLAHPFLPAPRWLLIHLVLLGAITHAILVWSRYFTDALLHTRPDPLDRSRQNRRLVLLNAGVLLVVTGVTTTLWPVTLAGAAAVGGATGWHALALVRQLRATLPARFAMTVRYYVAAAALLLVGVTIGAALTRVQADPWHHRLEVAHASVNVLGWIGLTALGTLVTLWPTMLRTRIRPGAERAAARALPVLVGAVVVAVAGALAGQRTVAASGYLLYLLGMAVLAPALLSAARARSPRSFPTLAVGSALGWLTGCLLALAAGLATAPSWESAAERFGWLTPYLAAGFGAQLLLGALSYLVPVALGGGPGPVRTATAVLERAGPLRVVAANTGLVVCVLPVPPAVRIAASTVVLVSFASFLPLLVLALRASRAVKTGRHEPTPLAESPPRRIRQAVLALVLVALAAAGGGAVEQAGLGSFRGDPVAAGVAPTGRTTVVAVETRDMRFHPATVDVPMGDRLIIELTNTDDDDVHDLVLDDGSETGRLSPGETARLDAGVVGRDIAGWCSIIGHHQRGMTFEVRAIGAPTAPAPAAPTAPTDHGGGLDLAGTPGDLFRHRSPALPPAPPGRVHRHTFHVRDVEHEVAPGVTQTLWTFNGTTPGPALHGRVGDRFVITLVNDGTMGHSIDFHAGEGDPSEEMRTIPPGERLVYRFTANRAGIWMYHCSTMPMSAHIANGLFGAVVIEPPDLEPVDRSFLLVQSELYLGPDGGEVDADKVAAEDPDLVVFNGYANQYDHRPLRARVGERVRLWVLNAGPSRATSFHVVGGQFDTTYAEGAWLLRPGHGGGAQSLALVAAQGGFVEMSFPEPGDHPFVSHVMVDAERG